MYCTNCGKRIPEGASFCVHCGVSVSAQAQESAAPRQQAPAQKEIPAQRGKKLVITLLVAAFAFVIGKFVVAPQLTGGTAEEPETTVSQPQVPENIFQPAETVLAPGVQEYYTLLSQYGIEPTHPFTTMESESYLIRMDDGAINCLDYGHEEGTDTVLAYQNAVYYPVEGFSEAQRIAVENQMRANCAAYEDMDFCYTSYLPMERYICASLTFWNVDQPANYAKLYENGDITRNAPISMSQTEADLIAEGAVKKPADS